MNLHRRAVRIARRARRDFLSISRISEALATPTRLDYEALRSRIFATYGEVKQRPRVLFVTSNGAGLGHLTRLNAVSQRQSAEHLIYTMSSAFQRIGRPRGTTIYFPSYGDLGMSGKVWNGLMETHFDAVVHAFAPDIIVFDGTFVYRGVTSVARRESIPLIWLQRGCWKESVDLQSRQRHDAHRVCDGVLIPGDYGVDEKVVVSDEFEPYYVNPIVMVDHNDLLEKEAARKALSLPQDKKLFLVQLGAGRINDIRHLKDFVTHCVRNLGEEWAPVFVRNPLSADESRSSDLAVSAFPLGRYLRAFDAATVAAGYNSVQESVVAGLPTLFIPNLSTKTDDQKRRALGTRDRMLGLCASTESEIEREIWRLSNQQLRDEIRRRCFEAQIENGANEAARILDSLVVNPKGRA